MRRATHKMAQQLEMEIGRRLAEGIPPCSRCGNTSKDLWAIDLVIINEPTEECMVCGTVRPILAPQVKGN